eukprot:31651-Amphidinium_carterae.1
MAMFGASPNGAQSSGVTTAPAQPVTVGQVDRVVPCNLHTQFGLAPIDGYAGVEQHLVPLGPAVPHGHAPQQLVPVAPHGQVPSVLLRPAVPLGQTSVLTSQIATHALAEQGSVRLRSELSRMISEISVSHPLEEPRGLRRERQ